MSILSKLFGGGGRSAMDQANDYLNQIPGQAHQGYDPYVTAGQDASGKTKTEYENLINDPTALINKIMSEYKTSEGYNFQKDLLTKELGNTAAMGGIAGTNYDQMNQGQAVQGLLSQDMQQWLANALGRYDTGLKGEEGIAGRGFDATKNLTDTLTNNLTQQAGLAFNNAQQNAKNRNDKWSMFGKALGAGAGAFFNPGGTAVGALGAAGKSLLS